MSIVACRVTKDKIYLACDSQTTCNQDKRPGLKFEKIIKFKTFVVCAVGTCAEVLLLQEYIKDNKFANSELRLIRYMADFYKWRDENFPKLIPEDKTRMSNCTFIFIINGNAYLVADLFITKITGIYAIGCGEDYAMGAMEHGATVEEAVAITCKYNTDCGPPIKSLIIERR